MPVNFQGRTSWRLIRRLRLAQHQGFLLLSPLPLSNWRTVRQSVSILYLMSHLVFFNAEVWTGVDKDMLDHFMEDINSGGGDFPMDDDSSDGSEDGSSMNVGTTNGAPQMQVGG